MFAVMRRIAGRAGRVVALGGMLALALGAGVYGQADTQANPATAPSSAAAPAGPAPIRLTVDATQAPQKILHAHMQIPVQAGPLTLQYAEWIPGEHMPDGPIINVAGLKFMAGNQVIPWRRDLVEMFSIHLDIPAGVTVLDGDLDFLLSAPAGGFSGISCCCTRRARRRRILRLWPA
jgi:hypothetical protein